MNKLIRILFIALIATCGSVNANADSKVTAQTLFRIEKLSTPTITIGNKIYRKGDTFRAGEEIKWSADDQSMLVRNVATNDTKRFSKHVSEKKGRLKSILDLYIHSNKGSSRGLNDQILLDKSNKSGNFPDKRIALIIGNQNYESHPLRNPQQDAEDIADELSELGFDIIELYETDYTELRAGIDKFSKLAANYDVALFYFAGHGIQDDGINYLVPVDNSLEDRARDIRFCVSCNHVVDKVEESGCKSRIFFFDACRENYTGWSRSVANGLSRMEGAPGTVIVFATESGNVAMDGGMDGNSPFASSLIKNLKKPSKSFSEMMDGVVRDTYSATNNHQCPIRIGTLMTDFRFNYPSTITSTPKPAAGTSGQNSTAGSSSMSAEQLYKKGENYYYGRGGVTKNYQEAAKWFKLAAEKGNAIAQNYLGYMYQYGYGVTKDYAEAVKWYRKSAEQGNPPGQSNLAYMYQYGYGVTKNIEEAAKWYRKAAEKGNAIAQNSLGYMYQYGNGVPKDYAEAVKWYRKAAEQGHASGESNLAYMYQYGYGVTKDYEEAVKWYRKSAEQGNATAQNNLGYMYQYGYGVTKDYAEAVKWYRKAVEQGNSAAENSLGNMYRNGYGVTKDYAEAVKCYQKGAEHGNVYAQNNLGYMYQYGYGVTKDYAEAVKWYRKAAEQGNASAQYNLGYMYEYGYGVTKDHAEAMKWYRKAEDQGHEDAKKALFRLFRSTGANSIRGKVVDKDNEPLIGCSVTYEENGVTKGTATDLDGNWKLDNIKPGTILKFSYVGCDTKKVTVTDKSDFINVKMIYK